MIKKGILIYITAFVLFSVSLSGCGKADSSSGNVESTQMSSSVSSKTVDQGDGTFTVSLDISNSEQKQGKYNLIFAKMGSIQKGKANYNFKSYVINADAPLSINISELFSLVDVDSSGNFKIGLTAARTEDEYVRNPLSEILCLTFPDVHTCNQGKNITLNMTDKPLTSLYPGGTLLVKIKDSKKEGGYVDFKYKSTNNMTLTYGKGSAGPDFLVAFESSEFKNKGIRDAQLAITDSKNQAISKQIELQFDENGLCKQGQFIEIEVIR